MDKQTTFLLAAKLKIIHAAPAVTITVDTSALAQPTVGVAYSGTVYATTTGSTALTITADSLPAGLTIGATTFASGKYQATVSGTPTATGGPNTTFTASDGTNSATGAFQWDVQAAGGGGVSVIRAGGGLTPMLLQITTPISFAVTGVKKDDVIVILAPVNASGTPTLTTSDTGGNAWTVVTNFDRNSCKVVAIYAKAKADGDITVTIASSVATNVSPVAYLVRGATNVDAAKAAKASRSGVNSTLPMQVGPFSTSGRSVLLFAGNASQGTAGDCAMTIDASAGYTEDIEGATIGTFYTTNAWKIETAAASGETFNVVSRNPKSTDTSLFSVLIIPVLY